MKIVVAILLRVLPSQFRQYGIKSPLTTNFINSELRYSYGALDGRGKAELALLYKSWRSVIPRMFRIPVKIFTLTFSSRNGMRIAPLRRYLTSTRREHVFAIALLLISAITIIIQKKTVMNTICFTAWNRSWRVKRMSTWIFHGCTKYLKTIQTRMILMV